MTEEDYEDCENPCCSKDKKERAFVAKTKAFLLEHDPVRKAEAARVIGTPVSVFGTPKTPDDSADELDDRDDDPAVLAWKHARLEQLKREHEIKAEQRRQNTCVVSEVSENQLSGEVYQDSIEFVVVHFHHPGAQVSDAVDELLDVLSSRAPNTKFVRVRTEKTSEWMQTLNLSLLPSIVCFQYGVVKARANGLEPFGGIREFREEDCTRWLARLGIVPDDGSSNSDSGEEQVEGCGTACSSCGRTYPHEHVRAVRSSTNHRAGDSSDEDI
eukprot:CAMPEP_0114251348 /NCGR_PEP_ID=MMETSP0058-20121206/15221_1 /TAXON_ID=36894 /ORGANISM="Pyramimonas parkeae, CCMP726" /LENGTH=270 /DNA_ID=CAMNT_0001365141 /DNA_START=86 /DNA_END=898 /DNA_ORIENTATION=+